MLEISILAFRRLNYGIESLRFGVEVQASVLAQFCLVVCTSVFSLAALFYSFFDMCQDIVLIILARSWSQSHTLSEFQIWDIHRSSESKSMEYGLYYVHIVGYNMLLCLYIHMMIMRSPEEQYFYLFWIF